MRLPAFAYEQPKNLEEALEILNTRGSAGKILAGGTDLLVRMKQNSIHPEYLISLKNLSSLTTIQETEDGLRIGAGVTLADILKNKMIQNRWPGFYEAVAAIGAPSIQHFRGTIGGNLCQDNRCQFFNQSGFFKGVRQSCNKAGGKTCYAWEGGSDRCHSIFPSDAAPVLIAMDAHVEVQSKNDKRVMPLMDLYSSIGEHPLVLADNEILTELTIPNLTPNVGTAFEKLTYRSAIDYAIVSAGALVQTDGDKVVKARLVIGAVSRGPLAIPAIEPILKNNPAGDEQAIEEAGTIAMKTAEAFIANNMSQPADYRIQMIAVTARRAIKKALSRAGAMEDR